MNVELHFIIWAITYFATIILVFFFFSFFNLKLPMPFSYFVIQFNDKTFGKNYDLIVRLFNINCHYMNELALRDLWSACVAHSMAVNLYLYPFIFMFRNIDKICKINTMDWKFHKYRYFLQLFSLSNSNDCR